MINDSSEFDVYTNIMNYVKLCNEINDVLNDGKEVPTMLLARGVYDLKDALKDLWALINSYEVQGALLLATMHGYKPSDQQIEFAAKVNQKVKLALGIK